MTARVHRLSASGPDDVEPLLAAIETGRVDPAGIVAILGKTEGNGCVNDFTRAFAVSALREALARFLPTGKLDRVSLVMSGGTEGGLAPHWLVLERRTATSGASPALAIGSVHTADLAPEHLGRRGQVVNVAEGYGRNYLLPRRLAMPVNDANKAMIDKERKSHEARLAREKADCVSLAERIGGLRFVAPRRVGENDVLYGSVTSGDVAEYLKSKGIEIDKRKVLLEEPIKALGEHEVRVRLHPEVQASLRLLVTKEG